MIQTIPTHDVHNIYLDLVKNRKINYITNYMINFVKEYMSALENVTYEINYDYPVILQQCTNLKLDNKSLLTEITKDSLEFINRIIDNKVTVFKTPINKNTKDYGYHKYSILSFVVATLQTIPNVYGILLKNTTTKKTINITLPFRMLQAIYNQINLAEFDRMYIFRHNLGDKSNKTYENILSELCKEYVVNYKLTKQVEEETKKKQLNKLSIEENTVKCNFGLVFQSHKYPRLEMMVPDKNMIEYDSTKEDKPLLGFTELLVKNKFIPYYSYFFLHRRPKSKTYRYFYPFDNIPMTSPNLSKKSDTVCIGGQEWNSQGLSSLEHGNLNSPYQTDIIHNKDEILGQWINANINVSKKFCEEFIERKEFNDIY